MSASSTSHRRELELRLQELEAEQKLATSALYLGAFFAALVCVGLGSNLFFGLEYLRSTAYVLTLAVLVAALLVYFAFVFGRVLKVSAELSKTRKFL